MDQWETFREKNIAPVGVWRDFFALHFGDQTSLLENTPQDPIYHGEGDVWTHTQMVVDEVEKTQRFLSGSPTEQYVLSLAAMLHDIAKPQTTQTLNGKIIAPSHSKKGAVWARQALWSMGVPKEVREQVCALISYHQIPFYAMSDDTGMRGEFLARKLSCDTDISLLCALAEADIRGRICQDQQKILYEIELFALLAQELDCFHKPYSFPNSTTRSHYVRKLGHIDANTPVYDKDQFMVYVLTGLPASGKDTWSNQSGLPVLSYDKMREELGKKHGQDTGMIVYAVQERAKELLRKKQSFVWNATFLTSQMRNPVCELIRNYGGKVCLVCTEESKEELLRRNSLRDTSLRNDKLLQMSKMWEMPLAWEGDEMIMVKPILKPQPSKIGAKK